MTLPAGNYKLLIQPNTAGYPDHWYGGRRFATARPSSVDGANTVNITVTGSPSPCRAPSQDGGAGPLVGAYVTAYDAGTRPGRTRRTDAGGRTP